MPAFLAGRIILESEFRSSAVQGLRWSLVSRLGTVSLQFLTTILLARLLSPGDFGLIGMITVFVGFANLYKDFGLGAALVQKQDTTEDHRCSVFWANLSLGILLTGLFTLAAPLLAQFYGEPRLAKISPLVAANFTIGSLGVVHSSLMTKSLQFGRLAFVELTALAASGAAAISMALLGMGVWSLAWQSVFLSTATALLLWARSDWRPAWRFNKTAFRELLRFSSHLIGFSTVNYWTRNGDNLLIGRFLGDSALGLYAMAYRILIFPLTTVSGALSRVLFPALASIQHDDRRVAAIYLRVSRSVAFVTFPLMAALGLLSAEFVLTFFGPGWSAMVPILRIFCLIGAVQSIGTLNGNLFLAKGRTDLQLRVGGVLGLLGILSVALGLRWGIIGVSAAYGGFSLVATYPSVRAAVSLVGLTFIEVLRNLAGVGACTALALFGGWLTQSALPGQLPPLARLVIPAAALAVVYLSSVLAFRLEVYRELRALVRDSMASNPTPGPD